MTDRDQDLIERLNDWPRDKNGNTDTVEMGMRMAEAATALAERDARIAELEAYAREATKAITGLTIGGSEYFGKRIGEMYTADLAFCVERIRERMGYRIDQIRAESRLAKLQSELDEARGALEPFANLAYGYDDKLDPDDRPVGPFKLGLCRRARAATRTTGDGEALLLGRRPARRNTGVARL